MPTTSYILRNPSLFLSIVLIKESTSSGSIVSPIQDNTCLNSSILMSPFSSLSNTANALRTSSSLSISLCTYISPAHQTKSLKSSLCVLSGSYFQTISSISLSVHKHPIAQSDCPTSSVRIVPSPSLSKKAKASLMSWISVSENLSSGPYCP
jgi:hypothetical protein